MTDEVKFEMSEKRTIACVDKKGPYGEVVAGGLGQVARWAGPKGLVRGPPLGIYHDSPLDVAPEDLRSTLACPVPDGTLGEGDIYVEVIEPRLEAVLMYKGPYEGMQGAYNRIFDAIFKGGYRPSGPCMEIYISDPHETAPEDLMTEIRMPVERA
jgi:AraC family transcriptional regulator